MLGDTAVTNIISFNSLGEMGTALLNAKPHEDNPYAGAGRPPTPWRFQYLAELN